MEDLDATLKVVLTTLLVLLVLIIVLLSIMVRFCIYIFNDLQGVSE